MSRTVIVIAAMLSLSTRAPAFTQCVSNNCDPAEIVQYLAGAQRMEQVYTKALIDKGYCQSGGSAGYIWHKGQAKDALGNCEIEGKGK